MYSSRSKHPPSAQCNVVYSHIGCYDFVACNLLYDRKKSCRILKHVLKAYDNSGLRSVVSVSVSSNIVWREGEAPRETRRNRLKFRRDTKKRKHNTSGQFVSIYFSLFPEIRVLILYHRNPIQTLIWHPIAWASCGLTGGVSPTEFPAFSYF